MKNIVSGATLLAFLIAGWAVLKTVKIAYSMFSFVCYTGLVVFIIAGVASAIMD